MSKLRLGAVEEFTQVSRQVRNSTRIETQAICSQTVLGICPLFFLLTGTPSPQAASWVLTVICIPRTRKSVCHAPRSGLSSRSTGPTAFPTHLKHASKEEVSLTLNLLQPTSQRASPPSTQLQNLARAWTLLSSPLTSKSHAWYPPYN